MLTHYDQIIISEGDTWKIHFIHYIISAKIHFVILICRYFFPTKF